MWIMLKIYTHYTEITTTSAATSRFEDGISTQQKKKTNFIIFTVAMLIIMLIYQ